MKRYSVWMLCGLILLPTPWASASGNGPEFSGGPTDVAELSAWGEALPGLFVHRSVLEPTPAPFAALTWDTHPGVPAPDGTWESLDSLRVSVTLPLDNSSAFDELLKAGGRDAIERYLIVGARGEGTATEFVAGVTFDPHFSSHSAVPRGFFPLMKSRDRQLILSLTERLRSAYTATYTLGPSSTDAVEITGPCQDNCGLRYQRDLDLCSQEQFACSLGVTGVAMGCVVACTKFVPGGPLWWGCVAACGVVDIAGLLGCIIQGARCDDTAGDVYVECLEACNTNDDEPAPGGGGGGDSGDDGGGDTGGGGESCADCLCNGVWVGEACGETAVEMVNDCIDLCGGLN